jgi:hypothetical protein
MIDRSVALALAQDQAGVISRRQLLDLGLTPAQARAAVGARRWRPLELGVYATFTGPVSPLALLWAAVLRAGAGAVAGPRSSLWLIGVLDEPPSPMDVYVPAGRHIQVAGPTHGSIRRCRDLERLRHPVASPPRLRVEPAVLEAADQLSREEQVVDVVLRAVQRRLTTPARLADSLADRRTHRWRALLIDLLSDAETGVASALERRWLRDVERPHGLPRGRFNHADVSGGMRRYRDVEYPYGLVIELDGREAHPDDLRFRDRRRDNRVAVTGRTTLRYGWREVASDPCGVAAETSEVLRRLGWAASARPCGPVCRLG